MMAKCAPSLTAGWAIILQKEKNEGVFFVSSEGLAGEGELDGDFAGQRLFAELGGRRRKRSGIADCGQSRSIEQRYA
jgi:hypothetical protein